MATDDKIRRILRSSGYPDRAEFDWVDFEKAYQRELGEALPQNERLFQLAVLFGRSFYLSNHLIRYPGIAKTFFGSHYLDAPKPYEKFLEELLKKIDPLKGDFESAASILRRYRYDEMIRLTVREITGLGGFGELGRERSDLAAACTEVVFCFANQKMIHEWGIPHDQQTNNPSLFTILGMGKLGGEDLNHSSDIDLIYFYSSDEGYFQRQSASHEMSLHQYFVRLGEMILRFLDQRTEDGFVYRVDLDLRPEGKQGTLANSIDAMETYYESFGHNWERIAMTKARPVAGSHSLGQDLLNRIRPFVFPRVSDFSTLEQLRDLKGRIEQSLNEQMTSDADPRSPGYNVKLGIGGIREIEFFVGAFQRLYGGRDPDLQKINTLDVLSTLAAKEIISQDDSERLEKAYRFLRTVENHLQMLEERQTHSLPKVEDELAALAVNMEDPMDHTQDAGESMARFYEQLSVCTEQVRQSFEKLLETS